MKSQEIAFYRGDEYTRVITLIDRTTKQALDISGFTFELVASNKADSIAVEDQLFTLTGTVVGDGSTGQVSFEFTDTHTDLTPKKYFYRVHMTGGTVTRRTVLKSTYRII